MADVTTTFAAKDVGFAAAMQKMQSQMDGFQKSVSSLSSTAQSIGNSFKTVIPIIGALGAAYFGVSKMASVFGSALELGGELNDLSQRTGESAGNLAILRRAFQNAGAGADNVGSVINKLQKAIVGGSGAFERLGLSTEKLKRMSPTDALRAVAAQIQKMPNAAVRAAVAMELFGKSGGELLPILQSLGPEFETAREQLGSVPRIMDASNAAFDALGDNLAAISEKGREFAIGVLSKIAPALADITDRISRIDAAGFGEMLSRYIERVGSLLSANLGLGRSIDQIKLAIDGIVKGDYTNSIGLLFATAKGLGMKLINEILAAALAAIKTIGQTLAELFRSGGPIMIMIDALMGYIGAKLGQITNETLAGLPRVLGGGDDRKKDAAFYETTAQRYAKLMGFGAPQVAEDVAKVAGGVSANFKTNFQNSQRLLDVSSANAAAAQFTDNIIGPTLEKVKPLIEQLQRLQAEPATSESRAKEADLIRQIRGYGTNELSRDAINRMVTDAAARSAIHDRSGLAEDGASEDTLKKVAGLLEDLNGKLPQPSLGQ